MENYYIFTTSVYDTLDKNKIYSQEYDLARENVALLATEELTGFTREYTNSTDIINYLNSEGSWPYFTEFRFEDEYIPSIDDIL